MKFILLASSLIVAVLGHPFGVKWKLAKSPLDTPHYQEVLNKIFQIPITQLARGSRITNGYPATLGQFKHQALLYSKDVHGDIYVCGGSVISYNWILTAGHCLENILEVTVYVGVIDRISGPAFWSADVSVSNLFVHEAYNTTTLANDIALIRLMNSIPLDGASAYHVELPSRSDATLSLDGKTATVSGFGKYTDTSTPSSVLQWVTSPIAPKSKCVNTFGASYFRDSNLCLDTTGGRSSCQGDSGGPLIVEVNGRTILAGVTSYGAAASCTQNYPAVFSRVSSFLDWINAKTRIAIKP